MSGRHHWKDYFYFDKKERRASIVLILLLFLIATAPRIYENYRRSKDEAIDFEQLFARLDSLEQSQVLATNYTPSNSDSQNVYINNDAKTDSKQALSTNKSKEEQKGIIAVDNDNKKKTVSRAKTISNRTEKKAVIIEVNQATAADFKQFKGIGEVLSNRIIHYRNQLGGFYSVEQVGTTYGLDDAVFTQFKKQLRCSSKVRKININTLSAEALSAHPYISPKLAQQMVNYREKIHPFQSLDEVKKLYLVDDALFEKLKHYIDI